MKDSEMARWPTLHGYVCLALLAVFSEENAKKKWWTAGGSNS